jgi:hypothetical protein
MEKLKEPSLDLPIELIARDGNRRAIADSAAPIRGLEGDIHGAIRWL